MRAIDATVALCLVAATVAAAPPSEADREAAALAVQRAGKHFRAGRFDEALGEYRTAHDRVPKPGHVYMMGRCVEALGRDEEAIGYFERFLALDVPQKNRALAERRLAAIRARLQPAPPATGTVVVHTGAADAEVTIDGRPAGRGAGVRVDVAAGRRVVTVTAPGREPFTATVDVAGGAEVEVAATLAWAVAQVTIRAAPAGLRIVANGTPAVPAGDTLRLKPGRYTLSLAAPGHAARDERLVLEPGQRVDLDARLVPVDVPMARAHVAGWTIFGVGAAAVVTGAFLTGFSEDAYASADAAARPDGTSAIPQTEHSDLIERGNALRSGAWAAWSVAVAALGTSAGLLLAGDGPTEVRATVVLQPGGAGLHLEAPF